jgi:hypothetical protein
MTKIKNILSSTSFWMLNKAVVLELGVDVALFLTDLSSRQDYWGMKGKLDREGFFFIERSEIESETLLSPHKQLRATKTLVDLGLLQTKRVGIPPKNYYKLDSDKVNEFVLSVVHKCSPIG